MKPLKAFCNSSFNFASLVDINPEHTNGSSIAGGGFLAFGDGGRQDSIRYDTLNFGGAKASISARDNGEVTAAIRYSGKVAGVGVLAGLGYEENFGNNIIAGSMGINLGVVAVNGAMGWTLNEGANVEDDFTTTSAWPIRVTTPTWVPPRLLSISITTTVVVLREPEQRLHRCRSGPGRCPGCRRRLRFVPDLLRC